MAQPAVVELPPQVARIDDLADRERSACASSLTLPSPDSSTSRSFSTKPKPGALRLLFSQDVASDWWLELQLLFMTLISGILDSVTYTTYNVFTTKQTGNFLFIAIYVFSKEALADKVEQTIAVSISCFIIGSFVFGQLAHRVRTRKRGWLILTTFIQALFILVVALVARSGEPREETGPRALAIVGLLSFAQAGQVSLAIGVGLAELNTTMITGAVISTLGDPRLFRWSNHARDRRILFILAYVAGCFAGSALNTYDMVWTFFLAFGMKMFACTTFLFTPGMVMDLEAQDSAGTRMPVSHILWGE